MAFTRFLQENLLCLLTFDKERCKIIRGTVEPHLFGGFYKEVVVRIYDYIDQYKVPPGEHIADLFEDKLESKNKREVSTYKDILTSLADMNEGINAEYVMTQLTTFVRRQSLRTVAVDLAKALQRDTEDSLDEADEILSSVTRTQLKLFDPGVRLSNVPRVMQFLNDSVSAFTTGIPEFDKRGFGPTRKEMFLYIADTKTGKTWCMIQLAKLALLNNLKVCHISLEMSENKIIQRYMQTLFALSKRMEKFVTRRFKKDEKERLDFEIKEVFPKFSFDDPDVYKKLERQLNHWKDRALDNIIVKQFPTGKLTVRELEAYLDNLEVTEKFVPDLLIVDYPDLMAIPGGATNWRLGLGELYKQLRGVAVARNLALAVPTQANRGAASAKTVDRRNVSEAYSKIADADVAITYSQTEMERTLGLARLRVEAGRNDEDKLTVVISQNYGMGQYVVDSVLMDKEYWNLIEAEEPADGDEYDSDED